MAAHCGGDDGSGKDANGCAVEPFGCGENLMLHGAFCAHEEAVGGCAGVGSGAGAVAPSDSAVQGHMRELVSFRLAAQQAADYLLKGPHAGVGGASDCSDARFMREALAEAAAAVAAGNHPFGAVLVRWTAALYCAAATPS